MYTCGKIYPRQNNNKNPIKILGGRTMQYIIVSGESKYRYEAIDNLEKRVKELILKGYKPQGGISVTTCSIGMNSLSETAYYTVAQAMIKED